ncbi:MAG: AMP-binding protein, partial [Candidatus Latescibacterota bacterium]
GDLLDRNAERFPHKLAFIDDKCALTWSETKQKVDRVALWLHRLGVEYGDFFVLQMPNVVQFFFMVFGLNRLGAIPVMCIPRHRKIEVNHEIGLHRAKGIIVPVGEKFDYVGMVNDIKQAHPYLKIFLTVDGSSPGWQSLDDLADQAIENEYPENYLKQFSPAPDDICVEQLSGGTTGLPKGIPRTYHDYICQWDYVGRARGLTDETVTLGAMPVAHNAAGQLVWGVMMFRGGTVVITKCVKPQEQFALIEKWRITFMPMVPVQLNYWMGARESMKLYDMSSLRQIGVGAQKVKPEQARWCLEELRVTFGTSFSMTEGPVISTRCDSPKEAHMYTLGRPLLIDPYVQIKLVDDKNREVAPGEIGEMISKGPLTFKGYFRNEEENRKAFDAQGFFHSGDLMSLRPDGRYVVEGRKKDMIIRGGENVYPEPVEDLLSRHPKVSYAAVIGMPDPGLGEKLCAFIQPREGEAFPLEELKGYLQQEGLSVFQWPERVEIVNGWPLTGVNKIDKKLLRAYITKKLVEEGAINTSFGNEYLKNDKISMDDLLSGKVEIRFTETLA